MKLLWKVWVPLISLILTIALPFYFEHRSIQNSSLRIEQISETNYNVSLDKNGNESHTFPSIYNTVPEEFGVTINGKPCSNIKIMYWVIRNAGKNPIQIKDYSIPITITTFSGAKILLAKTVQTSDKGIISNWRISSNFTSATLDPQMLNPGDWVKATIAIQVVPDIIKSNKIEWYARIAGITKLKVIDFETALKEFGLRHVTILFSGVQIIGLVLAILIVFLLMIIIATAKDIVCINNKNGVMWLILILFFSLATGEIIAYVTFRRESLAWDWSAAVLIAHLIFMIVIVIKPRFLFPPSPSDTQGE